MVRESLIESAVSFLQDPSVAASPIDRRVAFLQSKNLTSEEIDVALSRIGETRPPTQGQPVAAQGQAYGYQTQQLVRQQPPGYGYPQQGYFQQAPPDLPRRDWRDWFIMATVTSGVGYGLYVLAKRYVYPIIAPPTPPQLEQDKAGIDAEFARAFALIEQLSSDTASLKASEQARTERLDAALADVESVVGELKTSMKRREDEARRVGDEVRALRDLIPKAMDSQKEATDERLKELNTQLRGLKTLVSNRTGMAASTGSYLSAGGSTTPNVTSPGPQSPPASNPAAVIDPSSSVNVPGGGVSSSGVGGGLQNVRKDLTGTNSFSGFGSSGGPRAAIPAWQMAASQNNAANKSGAAGAGTGTSGSNTPA